MYIINYRKIILALVITAAVIQIMLPAGVFAAQEYPGSEKVTVTQEYTYKAGERPNIPDEIIQFGQVLSLVSVSEPVESTTLPETRTYTYRVSGSYTPEQLSQAPKDVKLRPVYGTATRQVDRKETIKGLSDNDVDKLPKHKTYKNTNGRGPGLKVEGDLALAEVRYEVTGHDPDGLPNKYTARVVYRGEETYSVLQYYEAETTYTRTVTEDGATTYTVVATYEGYASADDNFSEYVPVESETNMDADTDTDSDNDNGNGVQMVPAIDMDEGGPGPGDGEGLAVVPDAPVPSGGSAFQLPFSLAALPPIGVAAFATIVAALLTLVIFGAYNKRRARESECS